MLAGIAGGDVQDMRCARKIKAGKNRRSGKIPDDN